MKSICQIYKVGNGPSGSHTRGPMRAAQYNIKAQGYDRSLKTRGLISGAEVGCQGEIGVACSMASAAANQIFGGTIYQTEYAALSDGCHRVSFDDVVKVMKQTGHDLPALYKETSMGGLALMNPDED